MNNVDKFFIGKCGFLMESLSLDDPKYLHDDGFIVHPSNVIILEMGKGNWKQWHNEQCG